MTDLLNASYILDGVPMPLSPAKMLHECTLEPPLEPDGDPGSIADEHLDQDPRHYSFEESKLESYACAVEALRRSLPLHFSASYTCGKVAQALLEAIWMNGHFRMGDLSLRAEWKWSGKQIGLPASFYDSVEAACGYIDALGVKISQYSVVSGNPSVSFKATTVAEEDAREDEESLLRELPYKTANPRISRRRKAPQSFIPEASDWILYIPFDTCDYRLGGSALAQAMDATPSASPEIGDADYFIDCYEVVRELVEDGIVKAGTTVGEGGLLTALRAMSKDGTGAEVCIRDIAREYSDELPVRILFAEVPGVIIQISDIDYDYVDAELILQDVVYFPLGHPTPGKSAVSIVDKTDLPGILNSLMSSLEGED